MVDLERVQSLSVLIVELEFEYAACIHASSLSLEECIVAHVYLPGYGEQAICASD